MGSIQCLLLIMSKRSRGQIALENHRAKSAQSASNSKVEKTTQEIKSPVKKLLESPVLQRKIAIESADYNPEIFKYLSCFKTLSNVLMTFRSRRKQCTWESIVDSYQTISPDTLSLEDLSILLSIWNDSFSIRWQVKTFDAMQNPRSYEMFVELPPSVVLPISPMHHIPAPATVSTSTEESTINSTDLLTPQIQETSSSILSQRIAIFSEKLYTLAAAASARQDTTLGLLPNLSLIPPPPALTLSEKRVRTAHRPSDITEWAQKALATQPNNDKSKVTLEQLRERAVLRGEIAERQAERHRLQATVEDEKKMLQYLPHIADTLRSLSVRSNRSVMLRRDCIDTINKAVGLKTALILKAFDLLCTVVPGFLEVSPAAGAIPATVSLNRALPFKEVRISLVEYVRNEINNQNQIRSSTSSSGNKEM